MCDSAFDSFDSKTNLYYVGEKLLKRENTLLLKIHQQKAKIKDDIVNMKQKEYDEMKDCKCKGYCRIIHIKHRWISSNAERWKSKFESYENRYGHKCNHCSFKSESKADFLSHMRSKHKKMKEKDQFKCTQCEFVTNNLSNLTNHSTSNHHAKMPKSILKNKMG